MTRRALITFLTCALCPLLACDTASVLFPIETGFSFTNLARDAYAVLGIREHDPAGGGGAFFRTELLPPGATTRVRFLDALAVECPAALDLQVLTYQRVNDDMPIGLDPGEAVEQSPEAAGAVFGIPACAVQPLETYTVVNWDAADGTARVKIAQATPVETAIRASNIFPNTDAVWEISGVDPSLNDAPPALAEFVPIAGSVVTAAGEPWEDVGVLLRTRFRVRATDNDPSNDPDADYGDPIDVTFTDSNGFFEFARPPGAYRVEVFADDLLFQPARADVETPQSALVFIAEREE